MPFVSEVSLPETESRFAELMANGRFGAGEHIDHRMIAGDISVELGSEEFDSGYHFAEDIDFSLEDSMADMGLGLHVPTGLASKPLIISVAQDRMMRAEDPQMGKVKQTVANTIDRSFRNAIPQTDPIDGSIVTNVEISDIDLQEIVLASDRSDGGRRMQEMALNGLMVVISDFQNMEFADHSLNGTLAIKVNHLLERHVPQNIGPLALGGQLELNTNKPKQVEAYNAHLEAQHANIVNVLSNAGAEVVSIVAVPKLESGFDTAIADTDIAAALLALNQ